MTNCTNCGAPIKSYKCEYCDTIFDRDDRVQTIIMDTRKLERVISTEKIIQRCY